MAPEGISIPNIMISKVALRVHLLRFRGFQSLWHADTLIFLKKANQKASI